ncbi:hypothetical protein [Chitinophaga sancti]|uniref:hypothetical protein n=1 Tax=Chitinophaga sancti TaxID=1004 RepID=UPI003F7906F5
MTEIDLVKQQHKDIRGQVPGGFLIVKDCKRIGKRFVKMGSEGDSIDIFATFSSLFCWTCHHDNYF